MTALKRGVIFVKYIPDVYLEGQMTTVSVSAAILSKNAPAVSPKAVSIKDFYSMQDNLIILALKLFNGLA